ncbi:lysophosphatidic acid receptor 6-like [Mytilus californianus]|uniref:lysophosphatidic acid receptor 6-like n=1 Tax=Mytilus californianus TaxID=6549 RepID=UPI00224696AA|nr:lysophosphatidic acid receptor 6-like [Mytilus californianus]
MEFWKNATFSFLLILSLSDTTVLCVGLTRKWIIEMFETDVRTLTDIGCKINLFMVYFSMHLSSWTLVCVTAERFVKVRFPLQFVSTSISLKIICGYICMIVICICADCHFFWTNGLITTENRTTLCNNTSDEYFIFEEKYYTFIDLALLSLIPFIMMLTMNISMMQILQKSALFRAKSMPGCESRYNNNDNSHILTKMLIFTNVYFLCSTLPISIIFVVDSYVQNISSDYSHSQLNLATTVLYLFQYSNYTVNFYIYITINKHFRRWLPKCKICIPIRRTHHQSQQNNAIVSSTNL